MGRNINNMEPFLHNRFLVFAGDNYYPQRAWMDFVHAYDSFYETKEAVSKLSADWYQIVDFLNLKVVDEGLKQ